jgi:putative endonuclease
VRQQKVYHVYILASRRNGTLYVGVTSNLSKRVWQHREGLIEGFTKQYGVKLLVHYEAYSDVRAAIQREKNIKRWFRRWKLALIEKHNPEWRDLYPELA